MNEKIGNSQQRKKKPFLSQARSRFLPIKSKFTETNIMKRKAKSYLKTIK